MVYCPLIPGMLTAFHTFNLVVYVHLVFLFWTFNIWPRYPFLYVFFFLFSVALLCQETLTRMRPVHVVLRIHACVA